MKLAPTIAANVASELRKIALGVASALLLCLVSVEDAGAVRHLAPEEKLSEMLREPTVHERDREERIGAAPEDETTEESRLAVLPQLGYAPETGFLFGIKLTDRDFLGSGATLDLDGVYALEEQLFTYLTIATPSVFGRDIPLVFRAFYENDPVRRFYGLGNNDQGPDPASSHEIQDFGGDLTVGWRIIEDLSLNFQVAGWQTNIRNGHERVDGSPPTPERFPDLPGIRGGVVIPFGVSLVYDERRDPVRPTRGWRILLKAAHADTALGSNFSFTRFDADAGYLHPFFDGRLVLGGRVAGEYIDGSFRKIPFWELAVLGGESTLRGFFPYRFLGTSRVWTNLEARVKLFDFDIFDWWHVTTEGVGFTDIGRVFIDNDDLQSQGGDEGSLKQTHDVRVAYGGGLHFALGDAILVRLDVGFSDEETGLVYLTFGETF